MSLLLRPGHADPEAASQACFRALLAAHAQPGSLQSAGDDLDPAPPLGRATASVLLTLVDADTPLWLDPGFAAARSWLAFHTGAASAADPAGARFVCAPLLPDLAALDAGTDENPQDGATVIVQVAALGDGPAWRLEGPGLAAPAVLRARGLPETFAALWSRQRRLFPRGVDLVLCAGATLAALPRSLDITAA